MNVSDLRSTGRNTQGVKMINLDDNDAVASVEKIGLVKDEEAIELPQP